MCDTSGAIGIDRSLLINKWVCCIGGYLYCYSIKALCPVLVGVQLISLPISAHILLSNTIREGFDIVAAITDRYSVLRASYYKTRCDLLLYWEQRGT